MSKILVIEDEAPLRRALRIFLEAHDYAVVLAASGREGLDLAAREHPDAVILDLGLPDMDGVSVAAALRGWSAVLRSEERRVGKECMVQCRSRWSPYH